MAASGMAWKGDNSDSAVTIPSADVSGHSGNVWREIFNFAWAWSITDERAFKVFYERSESFSTQSDSRSDGLS